MGTATLTISDEMKSEIKHFSWVNWSEVAREEFERQERLRELLERLESKDEQELLKWSVELGRKAKKGRWQRILSELSQAEKKEL